MPFAEACSVCGVSEFMLLMCDRPRFAHALLDFLTEIVVDFALAQVDEGALMIGAGDAAASLVSPPMYREFALAYEQRVCAAVHRAGASVKLHICGDTTTLLPDMTRSGADLFNVDHLVPFDAACRIYQGAGLCFKGNLDPVADMLQATPEECQRRALECLSRAHAGPEPTPRYMLSAGCEVPADVSDAVFAAFCHAPEIYAHGD
jgi:MtaA/CmuA family methyltransferase